VHDPLTTSTKNDHVEPAETFFFHSF